MIMKTVAAMVVAVAILLAVAVAPGAEAHGSKLKVGYYKKSCRGVENVVKYHVAKAIRANRKSGAALVRLIFHDCFVRGCDASVLLDPTPANPETEKTAPINIGHCSSLRARLTAPPDQILPSYRSLLAGKCGAGPDPLVPNNVRDEDAGAVAAAMPGFVPKLRKVKDFLDNSYYHNNLARIVTFNSDWQLLTEKEARGHVREYAENGTLWDEDFADALLKLSKLPMPHGTTGEVRKHCRFVNSH